MLNDGVLSALDWWTEAGVDTLVDECPRDWLAKAAPPVAAVPTAAAPVVSAPPQDLAGFRRFLLIDPQVPGPAAARLDAMGDPASGTMILVDMPEAADRTAGTLLAGEAGALFDRMLAAMKLDRTSIYLAPFSPARPTTGKLSVADCAALGPLARRHIALAAPKRLLLMGEAPIRALLDQPLVAARGRIHPLAAEGLDVPTAVSFQPRFALERPEQYRKLIWADLQLFMGL